MTSLPERLESNCEREERPSTVERSTGPRRGDDCRCCCCCCCCCFCCCCEEPCVSQFRFHTVRNLPSFLLSIICPSLFSLSPQPSTIVEDTQRSLGKACENSSTLLLLLQDETILYSEYIVAINSGAVKAQRNLLLCIHSG